MCIRDRAICVDYRHILLCGKTVFRLLSDLTKLLNKKTKTENVMQTTCIVKFALALQYAFIIFMKTIVRFSNFINVI